MKGTVHERDRLATLPRSIANLRQTPVDKFAIEGRVSFLPCR